MTRTFLHVLPLEIREHIYDYVLSSPNGVVQLVRSYIHPKPGAPIRYRIFVADSGLEGEIRLSFIRTCKQIYDECTDRFWAKNTLDLESIISGGTRGGAKIPKLLDSLKLKVQAVQLDIDFFHQYTREFRESLTDIGQWAIHGCLKSISLVARDKYEDKDPTQLSRETFQALLSLRCSCDPETWPRNHRYWGREVMYYKYLDILKNAALKDGCLSKVNKKLIINTGVPGFDLESYGQPKHYMTLHSKHNAPEMLQELSIAVDGEVEVDGTLCFRSGTLMNNIFMVHDNQTVLYKKDFDMWRASRAAMKLLATSEEEKEVGYWLRKMTEDESVRLRLVHQFRCRIDEETKASQFTTFPSSSADLRQMLEYTKEPRRNGMSKWP